MAKRRNPMTRKVPIEFLEHAINELMDANEMLERSMKMGLGHSLASHETKQIRAIQIAVAGHITVLDEIFDAVEMRHVME